MMLQASSGVSLKVEAGNTTLQSITGHTHQSLSHSTRSNLESPVDLNMTSTPKREALGLTASQT